MNENETFPWDDILILVLVGATIGTVAIDFVRVRKGPVLDCLEKKTAETMATVRREYGNPAEFDVWFFFLLLLLLLLLLWFFY